MGEKASFFVLRAKAVPEVLLRVVEAKRLLDSGKVESVQEATEMVQISRSSFYKYKDDIFPYHENAKGKTVNMVIQLDDEPGLLSMVLKTIAEFHANITLVGIIQILKAFRLMELLHCRSVLMCSLRRAMWRI